MAKAPTTKTVEVAHVLASPLVLKLREIAGSPSRRPVSSVARPARRVEVAGVDVQGVSCSENRVIVACVALSRADITYPAMPVIDVVPLHKAGGPCACLVKVGKALGGAKRRGR